MLYTSKIRSLRPMSFPRTLTCPRDQHKQAEEALAFHE
jgi:hypothetical protein